MLIGKHLIKSLSSSLPTLPGVYQMIDNDKIIYVGKAKNLKNRIYSYSNKDLAPRVEHMVNNIKEIKYIITNTEHEALTLESDLIKLHQPKYNILLKDDKTFPFIKISLKHNFPRIYKVRDKNKTESNDLFGPYASSEGVSESIKLLQSIFKIRTCTDNYFNNRSKPCILHQINKCSAPCVNKISQESYASDIKECIAFLKGKNDSLYKSLVNKMNTYAKEERFQEAIIIRDRIKAIKSIENKTSITLPKNESADFISFMRDREDILALVFMFKEGKSNGYKTFKISAPLQQSDTEIFEQIISQLYSNINIPNKIYTNLESITKEEISNIEKAFSTTITTKDSLRSQSYYHIFDMLNHNLKSSFEKYQLESIKWKNKILKLQKLFNIPNTIENIEVFDNSHLYGTLSIGAVIYADSSGFVKKNYRYYNFQTPNQGNDDYAILRSTLERRFKKVKENNLPSPSLIIIDGGKGQHSIAKEIAAKHALTSYIIGVAKGKDRNAKEERIILHNGDIIKPETSSEELHFIQLLRDEAHRFAITSMRKKKVKEVTKSSLLEIKGLGPQKLKYLMYYFSNFDKIKDASIQELSKVPGIDSNLAQNIYNYFNNKRDTV